MLGEHIPGISIPVYASVYKAPQVFFIRPHNRPTLASQMLSFNSNNDLLTFLTKQGDRFLPTCHPEEPEKTYWATKGLIQLPGKILRFAQNDNELSRFSIRDLVDPAVIYLWCRRYPGLFRNLCRTARVQVWGCSHLLYGRFPGLSECSECRSPACIV